MSFFLNEEQEVALNDFLTRENKKVCEKQVLEDKIPKEFRDLIEKTMESGSPLPFFDPLAGYYTVSFTPCEKGDRIYVHHHLSGTSEAIYDPALVVVKSEDVDSEDEEDIDISTVDISEIDINYETETRDMITNVETEEDGIYTPK